MSYTENYGNQQVTVYPLQDLTSINVNQTLYGLISEGVYWSELTIGGTPATESDPGIAFITIKAGTTMVFKKTEGVRTFLGKVVLGDDYIMRSETANGGILRSDLWTAFHSPLSKAIHIFADWNYDLDVSDAHYVEFNYVPDSLFSANISAGKLLLGSFLNNSSAMAGNESSYQGITLEDYYRVDYSNVPGRNTLNDLISSKESLKVSFMGDGTGVMIGPGMLQVSDAIGYWSTTDSQTVLYPGTFGESSNRQGGSGDYQLDVLRLVTDETDQSAFKAEWTTKTFSSKPAGTGTGNSVRPDFKLNGGFVGDDELENMKIYLSGKQLDLTDPGYLVLICIRPCSISGNECWVDEIWPQNCYIPEKYMPRIGEVANFTRWKIPTYSADFVSESN